MSLFDSIAEKIVKEQERVIGPLAWSIAGKVHGLSINIQNKEVTISSIDPKVTIDHLVAGYERLFGSASREVCKDAVTTIIKDMPQTDIPASLIR